MKLKECLAINEENQDNIKIFNMDTDEMLELNEEASLIFSNRDKEINEIKRIFTEQYNIADEESLTSDIEEILAYFKECFYE